MLNDDPPAVWPDIQPADWPPETLEEMGARLEASGRFRVLRRLVPRHRFAASADGEAKRWALFASVVTTGPDPVQDEVIGLDLLPFSYGADGRIYDVAAPYCPMRDPGRDIPAWVTAETGIARGMVIDSAFDIEQLASYVQAADFIVAHGAGSARRFAERVCPAFKAKPWACSRDEVEWQVHGHSGRELVHLGMDAGFYFSRHVTQECRAGIEMLARPLGRSGETGLAHLLRRARHVTCRVRGVSSELEKLLLSQGYRRGGGVRPPYAWVLCIDLDEEDSEAEWQSLKGLLAERREICSIEKLGWFQRHSDRG